MLHSDPPLKFVDSLIQNSFKMSSVIIPSWAANHHFGTREAHREARNAARAWPPRAAQPRSSKPIWPAQPRRQQGHPRWRLRLRWNSSAASGHGHRWCGRSHLLHVRCASISCGREAWLGGARVGCRQESSGRSAVRSPSCSRHSGTKWRCTPAAPDAAARGRMESALPSCTRLCGAVRSCTRASRRRVQQSVAR